MMCNLTYFACIFLYLTFQICAASDYVPFVVWTNIRNENCVNDVSMVPGEYILKFSGSQFFRCLQETNPDKVIIFNTDELDESDFSLNSIEDNTVAFSYLQNVLSSPSSVIMPAVQSSSIVSFITAIFKKSFGDAKISAIELPTIGRKSSRDTQKSVSELDNIIREEINKLPSSEKYIAVLTANSAPQRPRRNVDNSFVGRQLLATPESPGVNKTTVIQGDCVLLAYNNLTLRYQKTIYNLTAPVYTSTLCNVTNSILNITFKALNTSGGEEKSIQLGLVFEEKKYPVSLDTWWRITSAGISHDLSGASVDYPLKIRDKYSYTAPKNWSWVCQAPERMTWQPKKDQAATQLLEFQFLQLQLTGKNVQGFSRALDCSGFLTGPIFMGTVISLLLAVIFAFGLYALMSITTMDRFDDPRGKTIVVHGHDGN